MSTAATECTHVIGGLPPIGVATCPNTQHAAASETQVIDLRQFPPIMLAVPMVPWTWTDSAVAINRLALNLPPGSVLNNIGQGSSQIARARNKIVESFLELAPSHGLEWILWVDSDMLPAPQTAARLLSIATARGLDLLSATCWKRIQPFQHTVHLPAGSGEVELDGVVEIESTGMACVLTRRRVFETMPAPWFVGESEDTHFWRAACAAGFRGYLDSDFDCAHMAVVAVDRELALAWQETPAGRAQLVKLGASSQRGSPY